MYYLQHYVIDWDKVKTVEDLKIILQAMEPTFEMYQVNRHPELKPYVVLVDKNPQATMD
jgi:hypothetical protein